MKLTKHVWMIWGIALVTVVVLAFVIPFARAAVYWLALAATLGMFGICAAAFARAFRTEETLESKLLGWPIFKVGYTALAVPGACGICADGTGSAMPGFGWQLSFELVIFALTGVSLTVA